MRKVGDPAPDFTLQALGAARQSLKELLNRGPVLLAFFKVACPVCQFTLPFLERVARGTGLQVVGVSQDGAQATSEFHQRFGITFPSLLDSSQDQYAVSNSFGISHVPSLFLVEPDGRISLASDGFSRRELMAAGERAGVMVFEPGEKVPDFKPG